LVIAHSIGGAVVVRLLAEVESAGVAASQHA
jgi:hypothetical protein